ncbi:MAG: translation elongation factor Ts [Candidatus Latescibacterota bacterium]|nr:MAG: translation elongation factor Ts [Candidatus Latescibacterota bacterium]
MDIPASLVKQLRERTNAGLMDCKAALKESDGDLDKAVEYLRIKGLAAAQKKSERATSEGMVTSYVHPGNRIGVLVEISCETDFVARTDEFQNFGRDIAMQIAATAPLAVERADIAADVVEKERELFRTQALEEKKPEKVVEKIVDGRIEKFYTENCLLDQAFIKDDSKSVSDLLNELISKLGENIKIARFSRFQIGQ